MRVYHVKGNTPDGYVDIEISRSEIDTMKKQIIADGKNGYTEMVRLISHPAGIVRYCMILGSHTLRRLLNICILVSRLGIIAVIILLFMRPWWWAVGCLVLTYLAGGPLQTSINYELGARLLALDKHFQERTKEK